MKKTILPAIYSQLSVGPPRVGGAEEAAGKAEAAAAAAGPRARKPSGPGPPPLGAPWAAAGASMQSRRCARADSTGAAQGAHSRALTWGAHFCAPVHDDRTVQPSGKSQSQALRGGRRNRSERKNQ